MTESGSASKDDAVLSTLQEHAQIIAKAESSKDKAALASLQKELFDLLRMSPRMTTTLSYDPSLLGYTEYIQDKNPGLARFLESHPEVVRNPEFYLFGNLGGTRGTGFSFSPVSRRPIYPPNSIIYSRDVQEVAFAFFVSIVAFVAVIWLLRLVVQHYRCSRKPSPLISRFQPGTRLKSGFARKFKISPDFQARSAPIVVKFHQEIQEQFT